MTWDIEIEHIGGIRQGTARLDPGVNAVRASNWHGKSSFIDAIKAIHGIPVPVTEGEASATVGYRVGDGDSGTVDVQQTADGPVIRGDPLLEEEYDRERVRLFAALDETNPVRLAVRRGDDLEPILTRPLDLADIDEQIAEYKAERETVVDEIAAADRAVNELVDARKRVSDLEAKLESLEEQRASIDVTDSQSTQPTERDTLSDRRAERERLIDRRDRLENTVENLEAKIEERREEREALEVPDIEDVTAELDQLQETHRELERDADLLSELHSVNRRILTAERTHLLDGLEHGLDTDTIDCWVCGSTAERKTIESQLDSLRDRAQEFRERATKTESRLAELQERRDETREAERRKSELQSEIRDLEERLADRRGALESTTADLADIEDEIAAMREAVEERDETVTELTSEIKYTRAALEDAEERVADLEATAANLERLRTQKSAIDDELERLKETKDRVERETRAAFQRALDAILDRFDTGFEGAHLTGGFELVVARDGREARLDTLSQGERELLGILAALAGHEAYDVADVSSVLLFDDLGGLMDENVGTLLEYIKDRAAYVVFTSYPSQAAFAGHEIETSDWRVVSGEESVA